MKRKSLETSSEIPKITITASTTFESKDHFYKCRNCGDLPVSQFSKSKINQFDRLKITIITCTACTCKAVIEDELEKSGAKKMRILKEKELSQNEMENIRAKKADPSALYEKNPLETPIITDAMKYFEERSLGFKIHLGKVKGWRTIAKLAVRGEISGDGNDSKKKILTSIGLFQPGSHKVIKCLESDAHHPSINICVNKVATLCENLEINGYIEGSGSLTSESFLHKSYLKYIIMAVERETNKVQLSIVWNTKPKGNLDGDDYLNRLIIALSVEKIPNSCTDKKNGDGMESDTLLFHSIWVNYNPSSRYSNAITCHDDDSWSLSFGKAQIKERVKTDMKHPPRLRFPPLVFRQANIDAFSNIVKNIRNWINDFATGTATSSNSSENVNHDDINNNEIQSPTVKCVELYAGVGTIGLNCLDLFSSLHCSDENPHNKACFDSTLAKMTSNLRTRAVYESKSASVIASGGGLSGHDIVIVDPPRKGLDGEVIDALLKYHPDKTTGSSSSSVNTIKVLGSNNRRLIYVSCGFKAFKRDVSRLLGVAEIDLNENPEENFSSSNHTKLKMSTGYNNYSVYESNNDSNENNNVNDSNQISLRTQVGISDNSNIRYWKLIHAEGHVLFPGSDHIETLAIFDRIL